MKPIHPIVYECDDFVYYLEKAHGMNFIHLTIKKFSHSIFKKMVLTVKEISNNLETNLCAYAEDDSTYRLMEMAGFKNTELVVHTSTGNTRRILCLQ